MAKPEVASETNRSVTSSSGNDFDRELVSSLGMDGPVTADGSLDIHQTAPIISVAQLKFVQLSHGYQTYSIFSAGDHVICDKVLKRDNRNGFLTLVTIIDATTLISQL